MKFTVFECFTYLKILLNFILLINTNVIISIAIEEVCERKTFNVKCEKDEKILFRRSRYGRMKV